VAKATPEHPNLPRKGALVLMFTGITLAGVLGGMIGYGLVMTSCADSPNRAERLLEQVPNFRADVASCAWPALLVAVTATILTAIGAAVVAVLMMRAQSEWRGHAPDRHP
jgi:ABC-type Fe3+ transport system permease subunit